MQARVWVTQARLRHAEIYLFTTEGPTAARQRCRACHSVALGSCIHVHEQHWLRLKAACAVLHAASGSTVLVLHCSPHGPSQAMAVWVQAYTDGCADESGSHHVAHAMHACMPDRMACRLGAHPGACSCPSRTSAGAYRSICHTPKRPQHARVAAAWHGMATQGARTDPQVGQDVAHQQREG